METIKLNEEQLYRIIKESVESAIINEGFLDNVSTGVQAAKSSFKGATSGIDAIKNGIKNFKTGYNAQKSLDASNTGYKEHWDAKDLEQQAHGLTMPKKTAEMTVNDIKAQAKECRELGRAEAAKYREEAAKYRELAKERRAYYYEMARNLDAKAAEMASANNLKYVRKDKRYATRTENPNFKSSAINGKIRTSALAASERHNTPVPGTGKYNKR